MVLAPVQWAYVGGYMKQFYRISHFIIKLDAPGRPLSSSHQEVLEVRDDHTHDMSNIYQHIEDMTRSGIDT